jgi:hypothetical protein
MLLSRPMSIEPSMIHQPASPISASSEGFGEGTLVAALPCRNI